MRAKHLLHALALAGLLLSAAAAFAAPPAATGGADDPGTVLKAPTAVGDELLLSRGHYFYTSFSRRDPFGSLLKGEFASTGRDDLLDIGELILVGVVWGENDKFAVVQDKRDNVHTLRVGDRMVNGKVVEITQTSLTVQHYFFGETANVTIQIHEGEGSHEKR
jgi:hypothetical protein